MKEADGRTGRELYTEQSVHFPEKVLLLSSGNVCKQHFISAREGKPTGGS